MSNFIGKTANENADNLWSQCWSPAGNYSNINFFKQNQDQKQAFNRQLRILMIITSKAEQ